MGGVAHGNDKAQIGGFLARHFVWHIHKIDVCFRRGNSRGNPRQYALGVAHRHHHASLKCAHGLVCPFDGDEALAVFVFQMFGNRARFVVDHQAFASA